MQNKSQAKSYIRIIRNLHRDIGFLVIGMTVLFCVSGVVLIYRDTDVFLIDKIVEEKIRPQLSENQLYKELPFRRFNVEKVEGDIVYFGQGWYNYKTGDVYYTITTYPWLIKKFNYFHRSISKEATHWIAALYGILLLFLSLSSFWMYKPSSNNFRRGIILTGIGVVIVIAIVFIT